MTLTEIAADLRSAIVDCVSRDESVSIAYRISFMIEQPEFSDEQIISFWLSISHLEDRQVPMFIIKQWAKKASSLKEWIAFLELNTTPPENN
jgi:hypothetical protein